MAGFFKRLKERVFAPTSRKAERHPDHAPQRRADTTELKNVQEAIASPKEELEVADDSGSTVIFGEEESGRNPYFVQIGFDFGTAFCKCIYRDILTDKAYVYVPAGGGGQMSFLIPSAVTEKKGILRHVAGAPGKYEENGLYHVKMALEKVSLEEWGDPVLANYRKAAPKKSKEELARFVQGCAVYLLAGSLGGVRNEIKNRFPGESEGDRLAVNMAVPVANADHPKVNELFERVLRLSWVLADDLSGFPPIRYAELAEKIQSIWSKANSEETKDVCYVYPEVSANVQGFVRSRTSSPGIYIFSDTGAGTVDQSVFIFEKPDGRDHLTYLFASVFPLGSSHLERIAAESSGSPTWENLELWRTRKEANRNYPELRKARRIVGSRLDKGTKLTISQSKAKLVSKRQMNELRVIFGGGGHCKDPYEQILLNQFDGNLFHPKEIQGRRDAESPFDVGMPNPTDLELTASQRRWLKRLTVAYGLSFEKHELASFDLPNAVEIPRPEEIWKPAKRTANAPSKDEC